MYTVIVIRVHQFKQLIIDRLVVFKEIPLDVFFISKAVIRYFTPERIETRV